MKTLPSIPPLALVALLLVGFALGTNGCGSDPATPKQPAMADIDGYVLGLNAWPTPASDTDGAIDIATDVEDSVGGSNYTCSVQPYSITQTPEKIVVFDPDDEIFWLGSMLQGNGYRGGIGSLSELPIRQRAPLKVWIDILGSDVTRTIASPTPTTVNAAVGDLVSVAENSGQVFASSIFFNQKETHSVEQSTLKLGLSAHYLGGKAKADLSYSSDASQNTVTAYFLQRMFTTSMELPQRPSDMFSSEFTQEHLQEQVKLGRIGADNQPVYISSIVYGRLMMLTITSSKSVTEIKAALSASYEAANSGGSGSVNNEHLETLSQSSISLVTLGGDANLALGYLRSGQLSDFFTAGSALTSAVPLSFTVRSLRTNEKALVSETTNYNVKTCTEVQSNPTGAQYRVKLNNIWFRRIGCDGGGTIEAYWNISALGTGSPAASASDEVKVDQAETAHNNTFRNINTKWVTADLYDDGRGSIRVFGNLYDRDVSPNPDDLVSTWSLTYTAQNVVAQSYSVYSSRESGCSTELRFTIEKVSDLYD